MAAPEIAVLIEAHSHLAAADWEMGTAARILDECGREKWAREAAELMDKCLQFRRRIEIEAGL